MDARSAPTTPGSRTGGSSRRSRSAPGTLIGDYLGLLIPNEKEDEYETGRDLYLMYYDERVSIWPDQTQPGVHIVNHSCEPNAGIIDLSGPQPVLRAPEDPRGRGGDGLVPAGADRRRVRAVPARLLVPSPIVHWHDAPADRPVRRLEPLRRARTPAAPGSSPSRRTRCSSRWIGTRPAYQTVGSTRSTARPNGRRK